MAKAKFERLRAGLATLGGQVLALSTTASPGALRAVQMAAGGRLGEVGDEALAAMLVMRDEDEDDRRAAEHARQFDPVVVPGRNGRGGSTVIMSARGVALYDFDYQPYAFSTQLLARRISTAAADPSVSQIIVEFNTPGGQVTGTPEAADALWAARQAGKKTGAIVNALAASAGYWIASQAEKVVVTPSGLVGSIGVFMMHVDMSKLLEEAGIGVTLIHDGPNKTEGNPFQPLSDESREYYQGEVATIGDQFRAAVARGRGVKAAVVKSDWGGGRVVKSSEAKSLGMVDRVEPPTSAVVKFGLAEDDASARSEESDPAKQAGAVEPPAPASLLEGAGGTTAARRRALAHRHGMKIT